MSLVNLANICSHLQNASKARLGLTSIPMTKLHLSLALSLQRQGFFSSVTVGGLSPHIAQPPTAESREELEVQLEDQPWLGLGYNENAQAGLGEFLESKKVASWREQIDKFHKMRETYRLAQEARATSTKTIPGTLLAEAQEKVELQRAEESAMRAEAQLNEWEDRMVARVMSGTERRPNSVSASEDSSASRLAEIPKNPAKRRIWLGLKYFNNEPVLSNMNLVSKPTRRIHLSSDALGDIVRGKRSGYVQGLTKPGECLFLSTDRGIWEARECVERKTGGLALCRVV